MDELEIIGESERLQQYWRQRDIQIEEDRAVINLRPPEQKSTDVKWLSNEPKVFYDTAMALVSSYPARFRMPLDINFTPEQKEKMNKTERFILGIFRQLDGRQFARGQSYWLRELAYWVLSGWYAVFNMVQEDENGVKFIADFFDPKTCYPEWDGDGLVQLSRMFTVDKQTAKSMFYRWQAKGLQAEFKEPSIAQVRIINYWRCDYIGGKSIVKNAILVGDQVIKPLTTEPFKRIPIHIGTVGLPDRDALDWTVRAGENIIASNRNMYAYTNTLISLLVTIMAETAYPNIISQTRSGIPAFDAKDLKGYGSQINLRLEDKIELLKHAASPNETMQLLSWALKQEQKGSIPDVVYGGIQTEMSGFAISQLMAAIKYKIAPYLNTMQYILSSVATDFLSQYKDGDFDKVKLSTENPYEMKKGMFFVEEYSKEDVPDAIYVDAQIPITSALDKTQQIIFARQALAPPQLISRETLWDNVLEIQDSEQEYARIIQDQTLELPIVKQMAMIEQLRQRRDLYASQGKTVEANALNQYIMALEMQLGMRKGIPQSPDGGGMPGMPPEGMPPEAMNSPDANRAVAGVPPQGVSRPSQTPLERQQNQGRKGMLVSPSGDTLL